MGLLLLVQGRAPGAVPFEETGMLSFADWSPDSTGNEIVSDLLESAIEEARTQNKTLYIPPGTYLIDRTIVMKTNSGAYNAQGHANVFGYPYSPPVIRLKDGTFTGNPVPEKATPAIRLVHVDPNKRSAWFFFSTLRNIKIDLGENPGAAGVAFAAAQDSHLINVHVTGKAFTTGFIGLVGRNQCNMDLVVEGGRFGILMTDAAGITATGIRLSGQTDVGLRVDNFRGSTVVGLEYNGPGIAVETKGTSYEQGNLFLEDARIEITDPAKPAIEANGRPIVLRNVYVKGTERLVSAQPHGLTTPTPEGWTRIGAFANSPASIEGRPNVLSAGGGRQEDWVEADTQSVLTAPDDLVRRHLPDEQFAFNHPEATNALRFPGATPWARIQAALESPARVIYVPAGSHLLEAPLTIPLGKVLVGDPGKYTFLMPTYLPSIQSFLLRTQDGDGEVVVENFFLSTRDLKFDGGVHWRSSGGHCLNIRVVEGHGRSERENAIFEYSGSAGGSMYAVTDHRNLLDNRLPESERFRKVRIVGTHNPLTFYGLNLERGGAQRKVVASPFLEVRDASNIRIFGMKSEPDEGTPVRLENVRNLLLASFATHRDTGHPFIEVVGEASLELAFIFGGSGQSPIDLVSPFAGISKKDVLVHLVLGDGFDDDVFVPTNDRHHLYAIPGGALPH